MYCDLLVSEGGILNEEELVIHICNLGILPVDSILHGQLVNKACVLVLRAGTQSPSTTQSDKIRTCKVQIGGNPNTPHRSQLPRC